MQIYSNYHPTPTLGLLVFYQKKVPMLKFRVLSNREFARDGRNNCTEELKVNREFFRFMISLYVQETYPGFVLLIVTYYFSLCFHRESVVWWNNSWLWYSKKIFMKFSRGVDISRTDQNFIFPRSFPGVLRARKEMEMGFRQTNDSKSFVFYFNFGVWLKLQPTKISTE